MEETGTDIGSLPLPDRTEWTVISGKNLGKRFENKTVLSNIDFVVNREQKIVLVGRNGIGKTTLLRIIAGEDRDYEGIIEKGSKTRIGYLSQTLQFSDDSLDIFSFLSEIVPDWKDYELRKYAGRFGFVGEDVFKAIRNLSGGEKLKVSLAKIILEKPNFIILDEPTNHLDIESIERLQTILSEYKGSMLVVTHDQWLIEKTFSTVWLLSETGISYPQSTETYLDSLREESVSFRKKKDTEKGKNEEYAMQKILKNRLKSIESKMQEIEGSYEHLEEHTKLIRKEMNLFSHDYQKLEELINKEKRITEEMEALIIKLGELEIEQRKTIAEIGGAV
jgi:ATP-binding cassette subfamily F protein 3